LRGQPGLRLGSKLIVKLFGRGAPDNQQIAGMKNLIIGVFIYLAPLIGQNTP